MPQRVVVEAPSRLHFGLYGFGTGLPRQFGGVGAMIQSPRLRLDARKSNRFESTGHLADRTRAFAERWCRFFDRTELPSVRIDVLECPRAHSGLGVGTQLGLSVAAALNALHEIPSVTPLELAMSVGRGHRSAVGTYGFLSGGLIAERGKLPNEPVSPLDVRVEIPSDWRFVLITPRTATGISGEAEIEAFRRLPPVPSKTYERLIDIARNNLIPSAALQNFESFSAALDAYCFEAGMCFAEVQGGPYNGEVLTEIVRQVRSLGIAAVGQSSWGPTLFAILPTQQAAQRFTARLRTVVPETTEILLSLPDNQGARISISDA